MIGVTLEDHLGRLSDALEAYKLVSGNYQANAQQRIANLTAKQLEVVTERKFLSDEEPQILVTTRNLEKVTVKIYRIDMADYFRKMHLATGIETLDIALIDPDKTWEYKIEGYEKYRTVHEPHRDSQKRTRRDGGHGVQRQAGSHDDAHRERHRHHREIVAE